MRFLARSPHVFAEPVLKLALLAAVIGISACATSPAPSSAPKSGGTFTYLVSPEPTTLLPDSFATGGQSSGGFERFALYDALALLGTTGSVQMRLADSMASTDGAVWTIHLRPNVKFSDGTAFDAAAVKFNWDRIASPSTKSRARPNTQNIASVSATDASTLAVTLKTADQLFPAFVAQTALTYVASPAALQQKGSAAFGMSPVGAGAYVLKQWVRGSGITLVRNSGYFGKTYLEQIVFKYIADEQQRYNTLTTYGGDASFSTDVNIGNAAKAAGYGFMPAELSGGQAAMFNTRTTPFNNPLARQAIAFAFDAKAMAEALYDGHAKLAPTIFDPKSPLYSPVQQIQPDAKKAQQLFDQLASQGEPLRFSILASPTNQAQSQWLQARLAGFRNVSATLNTVSDLESSTLTIAGNFQLIISVAPRFVDPYPSLTNTMMTGGSQNYGGYSNQQVDAALLQAQQTTNATKRRQAYEAAQQVIVKDVPRLIILRSPFLNIYNRKTVGALPILSDGLPDWTGVWKSG